MFSLKDPSLLAFDDRRSDANMKALFGNPLTHKPYLLVWKKLCHDLYGPFASVATFCVPTSRSPPMTVQMKKSPSRRDFLNTSMAAAASQCDFRRAVARSERPCRRQRHDPHRPDRLRQPWPRRGRQRHDRRPGVRLVAMTDIFAGRVKHSRDVLRKEKPKQVDRWTTPIVSPAWTATST